MTSKAAVDAAIDVAYQRNRAVMLIASRRQIESPFFGGGYVHNWCTEDFVNYVRHNDPQNLVIVCRDHGGPWQHPADFNEHLSDDEVIDSSTRALLADAAAGMTVLHIDTSVCRNREATVAEAVDTYLEIATTVSNKHPQVYFELGLEMQDAVDPDPRLLETALSRLVTAIPTTDPRWPTFVVCQTGTKVADLSNIGPAGTFAGMTDALPRLHECADIAAAHGSILKAHNCDYLTADVWALLGTVEAFFNVAPQYATRETDLLLTALDTAVSGAREKFMTEVLAGGLWQRWLLDSELAGSETARVRASAHYHYSQTPCALVIDDATLTLQHARGIDLDRLRRATVTAVIDEQLSAVLSVRAATHR